MSRQLLSLFLPVKQGKHIGKSRSDISLLTWNESIVSKRPFTRRTNVDSTLDSICMTCFLLVASGSESKLREAERNHDCELAIQMECHREQLQQVG